MSGVSVNEAKASAERDAASCNYLLHGAGCVQSSIY